MFPVNSLQSRKTSCLFLTKNSICIYLCSPVFICGYAFLISLLLPATLIAQQDTPVEDPAVFIRKAYHRLVKDEVKDFDECRKLVNDCKVRIALLAENDPEGFVALAREILLDSPELLESEKQRGLKPPRLEVLGSLMGALVVVGSESAHALLEELAEKVESGEAQRVALGANPADLLEVPVRFDRMITDALEGKSDNPKADLKNAIRFAQEHFIARILTCRESVPGLSAEELQEIRKLALGRIRATIFQSPAFQGGDDTLINPLVDFKHRKVVNALRKALELDVGTPFPEDWDEQLMNSKAPGFSPGKNKLLPEKRTKDTITPAVRREARGVAEGRLQVSSLKPQASLNESARFATIFAVVAAIIAAIAAVAMVLFLRLRRDLTLPQRHRGHGEEKR
jgi:hypothetical protein